jgi:L-rhamnose mutarotase
MNSEEMGMRVAMHSIVAEGRELGYEQAHERIPDDLVATFARVGIREWTIWRSGRDLFHLVEADDVAASLAALDGDPADARWQAFIGPFVERFVTVGDGLAGQFVPEVWDLATQRDG